LMVPLQGHVDCSENGTQIAQMNADECCLFSD